MKMRTELYWIDGPWPGRLAIAPRPRGSDWLEDEVQAWRQAGIDVVLSLLTRDEIAELSLSEEEVLTRDAGMQFLSLSIPDRGVPSSAVTFSEVVAQLAEQLAAGKNVVAHCRQGIGRAALVAICLLVSTGIEPTAAIQRVASARGCGVPETAEQRRWIMDFARSLVHESPK
jgi:protein-tyrosine phosphatase